MNPNDPYQNIPGPAPQPQPVQPPQPQLPPVQPTPQQGYQGQYGAVPPVLPNAASGPRTGHNPYEFIMASNQQPKRNGFNLGGTKGPMKLLVLIGGITVIVMILALIVNALIPSGVPGNELRAIVQRQAELTRVAQLAEDDAERESTKALAYNIDLTISSDRAALTTAMGDKGVKISDKEIKLGEDPDTDKMLEDAKTTSTYDSTYTKLMNTQLTAYLSAVKTAFDHTTNNDVKTTLSELYTNGAELLTQTETDSN